jgi:hypothetical protein
MISKKKNNNLQFTINMIYKEINLSKDDSEKQINVKIVEIVNIVNCYLNRWAFAFFPTLHFL